MYFTREPIIETIISPREGYKLVLRSSKHERQEEYSVDSVEVVTFGNHSFYRSLDRSETFLLPVFDYEIVEARATRLPLKTSGVQEKEIKIGKGKESSQVVMEDEKKREKRLPRKKRDKEKQKSEVVVEESEAVFNEYVKPKVEAREVVVRELIPPPSTLIADTISRYQIQSEEKVVEEEPVVKPRPVIIAPPPKNVGDED